jgi:hypothetical protein
MLGAKEGHAEVVQALLAAGVERDLLDQVSA